MRWFDGSLALSLTHNQLTQSVSVSDGLTTRTMQRADDEAHAVDFSGRWQVRVDTDRDAPLGGWEPERAHGPVTVWFPEHRTFGSGGAAGPLPEAAGLDDLPLWGVDDITEPGRLLDEVFADAAFPSWPPSTRAPARTWRNFSPSGPCGAVCRCSGIVASTRRC
ncbi:hypothetical protein NKH18_50445 [Streptomyces sp. M10(2022)]